MADMKTRVLTVDTGNAINNVKEFKQHIEDLKGTLLTLEKGTEQYNSVANELRESQQKLNEVMDVAKGKGEAVAGSYDNLVATMRELKKQWRATADEAERNALGQKILDINNQLKALDASTGNFQRNVGDYENAFTKAFGNILGEIGKSDNAISGIASRVKGLIPVISTVNKTAIAGLSGIKKAIASTGIGLLVVAVGELAANWDKVTGAVKKLLGATKEEEEAIKRLEKSMDDFKKKVEEANVKLEYQLRLIQAQGATELEVLEARKKSLSDEASALERDIAKKKNSLMLLKDAWGVSQEQLDKRQDEIDQMEERFRNLSNQQIDLDRDIEVAKAKAIKNAQDVEEAARFALLSRAEQLKETYEKEKTELEKWGVDTTNLTRKYLKDLADLVNKSSISLTDVIFNVKNSDFEKIKNEIDKFFIDLDAKAELESTKRYSQELTALQDSLNNGEIDVEEYYKRLGELNIKYVEESSAERLNKNKEANNKELQLKKESLNKAEADDIKSIERTANKRKDELTKYLKEGKISQEQYNQEIAKLDAQTATEKENIHAQYDETRLRLNEMYIQKNEKLEVDSAADTAKKKLDATIAALQKNSELTALKIKLEMDTLNLQQQMAGLGKTFLGLFNFGNNNPFSSKKLEEDFEKTKDLSEKQYSNIQNLHNQTIDTYKKALATLPEGSAQALEYQKALAAEQLALEKSKYEQMTVEATNFNEYQRKLDEQREERIQAITVGFQSIGNLLSNYASLQQQQIKQEVENGKISEAQGKKRFNDLKKLQIASALMNMASGVVSAIAQAQEMGPILGPIYAAINSAAVIAASMQQINSIKQQQLGSTSSTSSVSTPNVTEVVNEFTPQYTQNVTTDSELTNLQNAFHSSKFYVSVTDINDVQNKVKVTENETSF